MTDFPQPNGEQGQLSANVRRQEEADIRRPKDVPAGADGEIPDLENSPLFPSQQCAALETEWRSVQTNFVDSPRDSVQRADALVTKTIDVLAGSFSDMRSSLERSWEKSGDVSTEELRMAMQSYRSFFRRLLSI